MIIHTLDIQNFKKYENFQLKLHPRFTLLVGDNASGKTTLLNALAVALNVWHMNIPDSSLSNSRRTIYKQEIRLSPSTEGDRVVFNECKPVSIEVVADLLSQKNVSWKYFIPENGKQISKRGQTEAKRLIQDVYKADQKGYKQICPVIAYYGAGRAWLPSNARSKADTFPRKKTKRWSALYDSLSERIRLSDIHEWFMQETLEKANRGSWRPGFIAVKRAVLNCIPKASDIQFNSDFKQISLTIDGNTQPFNNLSAGQQTVLAMVTDIAIKAVTQNAFLLPSSQVEEDDPAIFKVLEESTGVILIDELDVHLHPKWQRRVASDLKSTFPSMQFICTSHSPQVIGELFPEEIRLLDKTDQIPDQSYGLDSNWILNTLMDSIERNKETDLKVDQIISLITSSDTEEALVQIKELESKVGKIRDTVKAHALIKRKKLLGR